MGRRPPHPNLTPAERFFLRRGREVVDEVLGKSSGGILVSDFYASYDHYPGLKQRCWAHPVSSTGQALLRDIHKLKALYPEDAVLTSGLMECGGSTTGPGAVGLGNAVAGAVPSIHGRPVGGPGQALPPD